MRKAREILRLRWEKDLAIRQIARSLSVSHSTVSDLLRRAKAQGLTWPLPEDLDDAMLERRLYPGPENPKGGRPQADWEYVHGELKRKGVTLQLLWLEYKSANPGGYQYSRFCDLYRKWQDKVDVAIRNDYRGGQKVFVDFAGQTVPVENRRTGEIHNVQIFVAVMAASNYTFAEAIWSQKLEPWIAAHCRALEFFDGVPEVIVPDQLKSGVAKSCRYEPDLNPSYQDMANHYGTVVIPARPRKPKDKAKVETAVQIVERWILARLRNQKFFDLRQVNDAISRLLVELNDRPFQKLEGSRRTMFEAVDKPNLQPLPKERYELATWKKARVNIDYHISFEKNQYSVPYQLTKEEVDVRATWSTIEILYKGKRVASHARSYEKGRYITAPEHRPASHQKHLEWTPSRLIRWGGQIGSNTARVIKAVLESRPHPEQGYRSCLGIMSLSRQYTPERLEAASERALAVEAVSYQSLKSILKTGLDQVPLEDPPPNLVAAHRNLRGPDYYREKGATSC